MSTLLKFAPYGTRNDPVLLQELNALTSHHLQGCLEYKRIWPHWSHADTVDQLPWLHVGLFKRIEFRTIFNNVCHERILRSSATGGIASCIALDQKSSDLQSRSTYVILQDFIGTEVRPLLILDSVKSLRIRGEVPARVAAALSLKPLAKEIYFLLSDTADSASVKWDLLAELLERYDDLLIYGFTWMLWLVWGSGTLPQNIQHKLQGKRICFVHSGGWKKLDTAQVDREQFDSSLLSGLHPESRVVDYYGLVEQVGIIYPLCDYGFRHVPLWASVIIRDPFSLKPLERQAGQIQLINTLAWGAPYHSVLTEDMGYLEFGVCPCGRTGPRFRLLGRVPDAEIRGCANV